NHLIGKRFAQRTRVAGGVERGLAHRVVKRPEKRKSLNVIPMKMREEDMEVFGRILFKRQSKLANACARIENQVSSASQANLDARRVTAVTEVASDGCRNRAANTPKSELQALGPMCLFARECERGNASGAEKRGLVVGDHAHRHVFEPVADASFGREGLHERGAAQLPQDFGRDAAADKGSPSRDHLQSEIAGF